jgi:FkbM family methyltransferase
VKHDSTALGSDIARDRKQARARAIANFVVKVLGLNSPGPITTEIVQAIHPIARIDTSNGPLLCRAGHGRLTWRARTFFTEEPDTIEWLDTLNPTDVFWDVGANVGLYSIYAAKFRKCMVYAFEPESQNYALLIDNMSLNNVNERLNAACIALNEAERFGNLTVPFITKGGAYNLFGSPDKRTQDIPESVHAAEMFWTKDRVSQLTFGCSIDDLVFRHGFTPPSHIKIDVDGIEYKIIKGAKRTLKSPQLKTVLIELNEKSEVDEEVPGILGRSGFKLVKKRSVWDTKPDKTRQSEMPAYNAIFVRATP